jgi:hypothetical protein
MVARDPQHPRLTWLSDRGWKGSGCNNVATDVPPSNHGGQGSISLTPRSDRQASLHGGVVLPCSLEVVLGA